MLNRAEEVATLNLATNAGIIAGVVLFAVSTVFTVDMVSVHCSRSFVDCTWYIHVHTIPVGRKCP